MLSLEERIKLSGQTIDFIDQNLAKIESKIDKAKTPRQIKKLLLEIQNLNKKLEKEGEFLQASIEECEDEGEDFDGHEFGL